MFMSGECDPYDLGIASEPTRLKFGFSQHLVPVSMRGIWLRSSP